MKMPEIPILSLRPEIPPNDPPGMNIPTMTRVIDQLLEQYGPKSEPFDPKAPRAMRCQVALGLGVSPMIGTFSETGYIGIYKMLVESLRADKTLTIVELFFPVNQITSICVERTDLVELAKKSARENDSRLWTPGSKT